MSVVPATLLLHRGHGLCHADLILGTGARCVTVRLGIEAGRWRVSLGVPHRRRYLTYRGPLSGDRGAVVQLWRGLAWCTRSAAVMRCRLQPNPLLLMKMRGGFHIAGSSRKGPVGGRGELVVPLHRTATLPRS
jgi:hypothetical protein